MTKYTYDWCSRRRKRGMDRKNIKKNNGSQVLKFNQRFKNFNEPKGTRQMKKTT